MENKNILSLSTNADGVVVGNLYRSGEHLLSMTQPAAIAAAIFAMGECKIALLAESKLVEFPFPISAGNLGTLLPFLDNKDQVDFMVEFANSSWLDFLSPLPHLVT